MRTPPILPRTDTCAKLFVTGGLVGPIVDSLHNQCLLEYDIAPITIPWPGAIAAPVSGEALSPLAGDPATSYLFCSSWLIPPLLGVAYVVLGGVLPRVMQALLDTAAPNTAEKIEAKMTPTDSTQLGSQGLFGLGGAGGSASLLSKGGVSMATEGGEIDTNVTRSRSSGPDLRTKALFAVVSTALIIKLSELLQTHQIVLPGINGGTAPSSDESLAIMISASVAQWALLDGTAAALLAAAVTAVGGPLSELPFVAAGCWHYIPSAADYLPLSGLSSSAVAGGTFLGDAAKVFLGEDYRDLALSGITGPCYFAVTMDAIALGRWFDMQERNGNAK